MEQVETIETVRGGDRYAINIGINAEGLPLIWFDLLDDKDPGSKGQPVREHPKQVLITFESDEFGRGVMSNIDTDFKRMLLGNNGQALLTTAHKLDIRANKRDKLDFTALFWGAASRFIPNGWVRKVKGFNYFPVFLPSGAVNVLTAEQEQAEGTGDYDTHNSDGTPIV